MCVRLEGRGGWVGRKEIFKIGAKREFCGFTDERKKERKQPRAVEVSGSEISWPQPQPQAGFVEKFANGRFHFSKEQRELMPKITMKEEREGGGVYGLIFEWNTISALQTMHEPPSFLFRGLLLASYSSSTFSILGFIHGKQIFNFGLSW